MKLFVFNNLAVRCCSHDKSHLKILDHSNVKSPELLDRFGLVIKKLNFEILLSFLLSKKKIN